MLDWGLWSKLLHVVGAFLLVAGLIGRELAREQARHTDNIAIFTNLSQLAGQFERTLVIPSSTVILIFGLLVTWQRGWPLLGFLQGASQNWLLVSLLLFLTQFPLVVFIFIPRGKIFERVLADAQARGQVTPELRASLNDPVVHRAHVFEAVAVILIIYLMVMKPF
jgi:uncharacterized membrane protein